MSLDPSWRVQEPTDALHIEQWSNAGTYMGAMAYGLHIGVYFVTLYTIWSAHVKRSPWLSTLAATVLFAGASLNIIGNAMSMQWAFIDYRNFPGGPSAFILGVGGEIWPINIANIGGVIVSWTGDAILLWRCYTVWGGLKAIVALPALMWLATVATGILTCYQSAQPAQSLTSLSTINFALSFWAISVSLNLLLTMLIVIRLFMARRHAVATLGRDYGETYTGIASIVIESASLYAIIGFIFIVLYGMQNLGMLFFLELLVQVEAMAPELIILRVARGKAWTRNTNAELTRTTGTLDFAPNGGQSHTEGTTAFGGSRDVLGTMRSQSQPSTLEEKETV